MEKAKEYMAVMSAHKIEKSFGSRVLFTDISFEISEKEHIGLVGVNGAGKSTLFAIINGSGMPDSGEVHRAKLSSIGSLEQTPRLRPGQTVLELALDVFSPLIEMERALDEVNASLVNATGHALLELVQKQTTLRERYEREGGLTYFNRTRSALLGLGFSEAQIAMEAAKLSGGQLNKAMLARVLLSAAELLLLDEPTNHLDIQAVEWLEAYLKGYPGAYIVISHDRYFLDQVTNRTIELSGGRLHVSNGNYSAHVQRRFTDKEIARRHYYNTQMEIRRIYGIVEQQRRWNRERNIRAAESKLKQIDRLKKTLVEPEREESSIRFAFGVKQPGGNDVLIAQSLKKAYGEKRLFDNASLHIRAGERVCLLGPNGCGKTTLLRLLMGKESADGGLSYFGAGVEPAYYEQNMRSMREDSSVLDEVRAAYPRMRETELRNALAAFLFRGDEALKQIHMLSGGERARVQLLKLMLSSSNMLLLDEPTNHLDIASRETLERALEEYEGAMLVVTHDRYLVNRIADRVLYMEPEGLVETIGGYDAFLEALARRDAVAKEAEEKPKSTYQLKKEHQSAIARAKGAVKRAEEAVAEAELDIAAMEETLARPEVAADYMEAGRLCAELEANRTALEALYAEWGRADEALSELEERVEI